MCDSFFGTICLPKRIWHQINPPELCPLGSPSPECQNKIPTTDTQPEKGQEQKASMCRFHFKEEYLKIKMARLPKEMLRRKIRSKQDRDRNQR